MRIIKILVLICLLAVPAVYCYRHIYLGKTAASHVTAMLPEKGQITSGERVQSFSLSGFSDSGKKTWDMQGKTADIFSDIIDLSDIQADSYGDNVKVNLKADKGAFNRKTNDIKLTDNVRVVTDEGTTLLTEVLFWDAKDQFIYTQEPVFIKRDDMDIYGKGALAKPNLNIVQLDQDVRLDISDPSALITCDGPLEIDYENNIAYFHNNVKMVDGDTTINTDKATAYFDPKQRSLEKIFCQGSVVIKKGEDTTHAEKLTYIPGEGRVILEGRPRIVISNTGALLEKRKEIRGQQDE
jgi:LPS export ABC transporter protein LptC